MATVCLYKDLNDPFIKELLECREQISITKKLLIKNGKNLKSLDPTSEEVENIKRSQISLKSHLKQLNFMEKGIQSRIIQREKNKLK